MTYPLPKESSVGLWCPAVAWPKAGSVLRPRGTGKEELRRRSVLACTSGAAPRDRAAANAPDRRSVLRANPHCRRLPLPASTPPPPADL